MEIAEDHNIKMVEDCAHALGALYQGKNVGTFGAVGCFSFYPTKIITTIEGGMATTQDKEIAKHHKK
jgi:perosamine synthetase